jgi:hypothetical protein
MKKSWGVTALRLVAYATSGGVAAMALEPACDMAKRIIAAL